jgi:uncharacterized membrane protein
MADQATHRDVFAVGSAQADLPAVHRITPADLREALAKGLDDFWAMPTHVVFLSLIYPVVGIILARLTFGYGIIPLLYPLAAGFALIGPIAAIGLYELSRRRELGMRLSWQHAFDVVYAPSARAIAALGLLLLFIFMVWIGTAHAIYVANFGYAEPTSLSGFVRDVLTTPAGHNLILWGNAVGFLFAVVAFAISVVSFPMLLDRDTTAIAAMATSIRAVIRNPGTMALWGLIIVALLVIGSLPAFLGLAVVMPVLGHASWHLYRKVVEPNPNPRADIEPPPRPRRYAADFPAALFAGTEAPREREERR